MAAVRRIGGRGRTGGSILRAELEKVKDSIAHAVAQSVAPELTRLARESFDRGLTAYDEPRPRSLDGRALTLTRSGAMRRTLRFSASGRIVRAVLAVPYARYYIGFATSKRKSFEVLPPAFKRLPPKWKAAIDRAVERESAVYRFRKVG